MQQVKRARLRRALFAPVGGVILTDAGRAHRSGVPE